MKKSYIITSFIAFTTLGNAQDAATAEPAAETPKNETPAPQVNEKLKEVSQEFANLPEADRMKYLNLRNEASQLFQNKRIFETLEIVRQSETIFKNDPQLLNLKGACYVELRNFNAARNTFTEALEITGPTSNILFNLAEIEFVTDNWPKAIKLLTEVRAMSHPKATQMIHLIDFKILLCHIKLSKDESITKDEREKHKALVSVYANKVDRLEDSPYYYYANAAKNYYMGNQTEADTFLASGRRVFSESPNIVASWEDTLVEFGYIKSYLSDKEGEEVSPLVKP